MEKQLKPLVSSPRSLSLNKACGKGESLFFHRSHCNLDSSYILPQTGYLHPPCSYFSVSVTKAPGRSGPARHVNQICLSVSPDPRGTVGTAVVLPTPSYLWLSPWARRQAFVNRGAKRIRPDTLWDPILQTLQFCEETAYKIPLRRHKPEVKMEVCLDPSAIYLSLNFSPIFSNNQIFYLFWVF